MNQIVRKFVLCFGMLISCVFAHAFDVDGISYTIKNDGHVSVARSYDYADYSTIVIPENVTYNGETYTVISIDENAFAPAQKLISISLPLSLKEMAPKAFSGCKKLESITIPPLLERIETMTFYGCESLRQVKFSSPNSLTYIGKDAFYGCNSLTSIELPESLREIGEFAFDGCSSLTSIRFPENLVSVARFAFADCSHLENVFINSALKEIPEGCFISCPNLSNVIISNGVLTIGDEAFSGGPAPARTKISHIIIPPSVQKIGGINFEGSNVVLFRGNISLDDCSYTSYYILDSNFPTLRYWHGSSHFYVNDKDSFKQLNGRYVPDNYIHQLNDGLESVSLRYNGFPQGPDRNTMKWSVGEKLKSMGISFQFMGIENTNCGTWHDLEDVTFTYNDWSFTTGIYYDYTITPIPLNIKLESYTREYGEENPAFNFSCTGFIGNDNIENSLQEFSISCAARNNSNVGTYPITITASAQNYYLNITKGTLTVTPAPLVLSALNTNKVYGEENPQFQIKCDGLKLDEPQSQFLIKYPTISCLADESSSVGEYDINVTGGEFRNYQVAEYKSGKLSISKAPLELLAKDSSRLYSQENPAFEFSLNGLRNGDTESCLSNLPQYHCEANDASGCGTYSITPYGASASNYEITYKPGLLTVTKTPLNIVVKDCSRVYGAPNPKFEFVYSGFKDGDDATVLTKLPTVLCEAKPNSPVGYYDVALAGAEANNYEISYTPGVLTVAQAPLKVRAKDTSRTYGSENPTFELQYMGFKNDDNESCLFRVPQISTTATINSAVGTYPLTVSNGQAQNYVLEYEDAELTITNAKLTGKVANASREYGCENPQFAIEYSGFIGGDTESVITTKPQFKTDATEQSNTGDYVVSAQGASAQNYDFEFIPGTLTIEPKQISAQVGDYARAFGTANPEFEVEYRGLVNGDDKSAISEPTIAKCQANVQSGVGQYPIVLSGGRGQNYEVTSFSNGVLTVERANQTIEWNQDLGALNQYDQIELNAVASSGLPITYDIANKNVVEVYTSGDKTYLDCHSTGTVTIRATQKGNENYYPSETLTKRVTVLSEGGFIDPSNPEISINVTTAGTLEEKIDASKKYQIKSLTVSGYLNGSDIKYLREMAGRDVNGNTTTGILEKLNLSRATIVSGGDYYYTTTPSYSSGRKYTSNNAVSDYMFYGCGTLSNLTLPQNCTKIGEHAFDGCANLSNIFWSDDILSIGAYAFNGDISLSRISIPKNTSTIGNYAFSGCTGLNKLILSSSVKNIGDGVLSGCPNIEEITLNDENAFYATLNGVLYNKACTNLIVYPAGKTDQTFEVPEGVTEIRNSAFYGVTALNYLFLPESLTSIGIDAFKGCSNLSKLYARPIEPAVCANSCFESVSMTNCTLYVPRYSFSAYWAAPVWANFNKIEATNDLSVGGNIAKPDYCLEFTETLLSKGKWSNIPVVMNNVDPVVAISFDIVLPEGVDIYKDTNGKIEIKTTDRVPMSQRFNANDLEDGVVKVICYSIDNEPFTGNDGVLFYLPLFLTDNNADVDSEYTLKLENIEFTKKTQSGYTAVKSPNVSATLTIAQYTMGDANGDGRITSSDIAITVDNILGKNPEAFIFKAADMNLDGTISGIDVVLIIDEFLAQNSKAQIRAPRDMDYYGCLQLESKSDNVYSHSPKFEISLPGAWRYTSIAMDVTLPEGLHIKSMNARDNDTHSIRYLEHPNGLTRILISSFTNENFTSDHLITIELEGDNFISLSKQIVIDDVYVVEIDGQEYNELAIEGINVDIAAISGVSCAPVDGIFSIWVENSTLYVSAATECVVTLSDIVGHVRHISVNAGVNSIHLVPGVYIVNDKKIIIK